MALGLPWRSEGPQEASRRSSLEEPRSQKTLALVPLLRSMESRTRPHVLDLGPPAGDNLSFFASFGARLSIADLYRGLHSVRPELEGEGGKDHVFARLLPGGASTPFDAVLLWDLLDYLKPEEIAWLTRSLGPRCKPGATMLALVASSGTISPKPAQYRIQDAQTFVREAVGPRSRAAPRYSEQMLLRFMSGMDVESRFQLRNETVEYLFTQRVCRV